MTEYNDKLVEEISKIRRILEEKHTRAEIEIDWKEADAFMWQSERRYFRPVKNVNSIPLELLQGIDQNIDILLENTTKFSKSLPANNALLWGARGMGKSSLIKGIHGKLCKGSKKLVLIEIHREDIRDLPDILGIIKQYSDVNFIIFCDDLSFDNDDTTYKSLKTALEGN